MRGQGRNQMRGGGKHNGQGRGKGCGQEQGGGKGKCQQLRKRDGSQEGCRAKEQSAQEVPVEKKTVS
nr:hypothetical protein [Desulfobulbaceae bacterium]